MLQTQTIHLPGLNGSSALPAFKAETPETASEATETEVGPILSRPKLYAVYRDPSDVNTIKLLSLICLSLSFIVLALVGNSLYLYFRKPDRIVIERTPQGEVMLDNRTYGHAGGISISPDNPTTEDKLSVAKKWMTIFNEVDPEVRVRKQSLQQVLGAMVPQAAIDMGTWLKTSGTAARERDEAWSATFEIQTAELINKDTVRVLGTQTVKKIQNGIPSAEKIQIEWKIGLTPDPAGRKERNFNTGYLVTGYSDRLISRTPTELFSKSDTAPSGTASPK